MRCRSSARGQGAFFVQQFKHRIPQYAAPQGEGGYHRLGAGERLARQHLARKAYRVRPINIENWSVTLDLKIMAHGRRRLFQRAHA